MERRDINISKSEYDDVSSQHLVWYLYYLYFNFLSQAEDNPQMSDKLPSLLLHSSSAMSLLST